MVGSVRLTQRFFERNGVSMVLNIALNETEPIAWPSPLAAQSGADP